LTSRTLLAAAVAVAFAALAPATTWAQADQPAAAPAPAPMASTPTSPALVANGSIVATLKASSHFTILSKAIEQAQLAAVLGGTPGLTLFAPTDEAFAALPPAQLKALLNADNADVLQKILIYHLVNTRLDGAKIKGAKGPVPSVEKSQLQLDGSGPLVKVNDAQVIQADVVASNGIIHVIDKVLVPPDVTLPAS
jgi:uncharacterized surface protein with fasciclin (FAS1) repeats